MPLSLANVCSVCCQFEEGYGVVKGQVYISYFLCCAQMPGHLVRSFGFWKEFVCELLFLVLQVCTRLRRSPVCQSSALVTISPPCTLPSSVMDVWRSTTGPLPGRTALVSPWVSSSMMASTASRYQLPHAYAWLEVFRVNSLRDMELSLHSPFLL